MIVGRDSTVILKDDSDEGDDVIKKRVEELTHAHSLTKKKADREFILSRIASLTGGIGVIYVGGNTDLEQKELYDRVDDAVCAVRSALEEGILPGGGVALHSIAADIDIKEEDSLSKCDALIILEEALESPICQILSNAGKDFADVYKDILDGDKITNVYNVKTGKYGDAFKMGVIDPLKVTRSALQNAVSVAVTILSTDAIVTMARSYEKE